MKYNINKKKLIIYSLIKGLIESSFMTFIWVILHTGGFKEEVNWNYVILMFFSFTLIGGIGGAISYYIGQKLAFKEEQTKKI